MPGVIWHGMNAGVGMSAITRSQKVVLSLALLSVIAAGVCSGTRFGAIAAFVTSAAALSLLAMVVGEATDQLGTRMGPGATGVLQSALGNLPELFVCIFSLRAGLVEVVKGALVGSILANSLLVLGLAILLGGLKNGTQKFVSEAPRMMVVLITVSTAALIIPTFAQLLHTPAEKHEVALSSACAVVLIIILACSIPFFVKGNPALAPQAHDPGSSAWPVGFAISVLAVAGVGAAFVSEWFVDALLPATKLLGMSEAFAGLVVAAIAGNAIENVVGIQLAYRNKADYALSVVLNSALQIALGLVPILVFVSFFVGAAPLTLVFSPLLVAGLVLSAIVTAFIVFDGESIWLEGVALIGLYAILVSAFWWG